MVGHDAKGLARLAKMVAERMEHSGIGAIDDDGMRMSRIEPAACVVVAEPGGDKDRVIGGRVGLRQMCIHPTGSFARVVVIDALDTTKPWIRLFGGDHFFIGEFQRPVEPGVRAHDEIDAFVQAVSDPVATAPQIRGKLRGPLVASAIGSAARTQVERHGCGLFVCEKAHEIISVTTLSFKLALRRSPCSSKGRAKPMGRT